MPLPVEAAPTPAVGAGRAILSLRGMAGLLYGVQGQHAERAAWWGIVGLLAVMS